jgi:hypothetical protein
MDMALSCERLSDRSCLWEPSIHSVAFRRSNVKSITRRGNPDGRIIAQWYLRLDSEAIRDAFQPMFKSPLPGPNELLRHVKDKLGPNRKALLIAIDGADGVGKSSLASWLAWQLGMPSVHLDLYLIRDSKPLTWMTDEVARLIQTRINLEMPVIVEGIFVLDALDQINLSPDFLIYVRGEGGHSLSAALSGYRERRNPISRAHCVLDGFSD